MIETIWIIAIVIFVLGVGILYFSRREPTRNGYQPRRRTRIKGARTIIKESQHPIVGDGPWCATVRAEYPEGEINGVLPRRPWPRSAEPRGM